MSKRDDLKAIQKKHARSKRSKKSEEGRKLAYTIVGITVGVLLIMYLMFRMTAG